MTPTTYRVVGVRHGRRVRREVLAELLARGEAEDLRASFARKLTEFREILIEEEVTVTERKNAVFNLADARRRTPPPDPVAGMRNSLQLALFGAVTETDVCGMAQKLKQMAMEGNLQAMKLFFSLVTGGGGMSAPAAQQQPQAVVYVDARTGQVLEPGRPPEPADAPAGSEDKILLMQERLARGESLTHPADAPPPDARRNGRGRPGEADDAD